MPRYELWEIRHVPSGIRTVKTKEPIWANDIREAAQRARDRTGLQVFRVTREFEAE